VEMLDPIKQKPIGPAEVMEKFGVPPEKMRHVQALIGDSTDNVPGVPGVGPKRAAELINEFGDLAGIRSRLPYVRDLGVDGILSDRPTLLKEVFVRRGLWR